MSAEVAEEIKPRGRPPGKAPVWREAGLCLHELSFARAVVQGVPVVAAAERYLPEGLLDERVASAELRRVMRVAADVLAGVGDTVQADALRAYGGWSAPPESSQDRDASVSEPAMAIPSLDEFAEEIGAEDFSEQELLALYEDRYSEALKGAPGQPQAPAQKVPVESVLRALGNVQSRGVLSPNTTDPVRLWLSEGLTQPLAGVGIANLQDLVQYVNRHGRHWYRHIPGIGQDRARRLVGWLVQQESFLDLKVVPRSRWSCAAKVETDGMEKHTLWFSIPSREAGMEVTAPLPVMPEPGLSADNQATLRSSGPNALGAQSDRDAVKAWLDSLSFKSPHTRTAYAREAQRLLLWAHEQGKTLSTLSVSDAADHARFLVNPPAHWVCALPTRRDDDQWRPMRGALSEASARRALAAIGHLYGFLVETGYLVANPFARIRCASERGRVVRIDTTRAFRSYHLQMLVDVVHRLPYGPAQRRACALITLLIFTGVRIGELGGTWGDVVTTTVNLDEAGRATEAPCLRVIGKGGKERLIPLQPSVVLVLKKHLEDRRALELQGLVPALEKSETPLISVVAKPVGPDLAKPHGGLSVAGIHRVIKSLCERAAQGCGDAGTAAEFRKASAHWMRHTFAHTVLQASGGDLPVTQQLLGHASIATTGIYVKADMGQRLRAVMAMPSLFDTA